MKKRLLPLLTMLIICKTVMAQTPAFCPSNDVPATDFCPQTCIYCNLQEYTGNTDGYTSQTPPGFCGTIENEQWLGFIAGASFATISVVPANCQIGNGMQVALYSGCNSTPIGCNGGFAGGGFFPVSITVPLTPGTPYYLMIDSYAGDICDFTVTMSPPGAALVGFIDTNVVQLCPFETFTFNGVEYEAPAVLIDTIPNPAGACDSIIVYNLVSLPYVNSNQIVQFCPGDTVVIGGVPYTQPGFVTDTIPSTGAGCDTIAKYALFFLNQPTVTKSLAFCPGSSVTIGGTVYTQPGTVSVQIPSVTGGCDTLATYVLTWLPIPTTSKTIEFCAGKSVTIGGVVYTSAGTVIDTIPGTGGGCDSIVTYTLQVLPYNTSAQTIEFCAGTSVTVGGVTYTQSGTAVDTISSVTTGCDTIITYTLVRLPYNTRSETIEFCPGDIITIGGNDYTEAGTVVDTVSGSAGCDTIVTYTLVRITSPGSSVSIKCAADISIGTQPGTGPFAVTYDLPTASSDCACPGIGLVLTDGLPSGSLFPVTTTTVCYEASDSCGNTASCCFKVTVREEAPCDIKVIGCMKYELLSITKGATTDLTYEIRVTNNCSNKMIYTAIQLPDGIVAVKPVNNSVFTAPSGRKYDVRNPNYSPFYSVRFKSQADSIANGQADIFKYTLPGQTKPDYIHIASRLYPQVFFEAHLNTFNCPITPETGPKERELTLTQSLRELLVFPNPTSGVLYADLSAWNGQELTVRVSNGLGQQIRQLNLTAHDEPQEVELPAGLAGGIYFLEVLTGTGEKQTARFVIQR